MSTQRNTSFERRADRLPEQLVAGFRATLEEVVEASAALDFFSAHNGFGKGLLTCFLGASKLFESIHWSQTQTLSLLEDFSSSPNNMIYHSDWLTAYLSFN